MTIVQYLDGAESFGIRVLDDGNYFADFINSTRFVNVYKIFYTILFGVLYVKWKILRSSRLKEQLLLPGAFLHNL